MTLNIKALNKKIQAYSSNVYNYSAYPEAEQNLRIELFLFRCYRPVFAVYRKSLRDAYADVCFTEFFTRKKRI